MKRPALLPATLLWLAAGAAQAATYELVDRSGPRVEEPHPSVTVEAPQSGRVDVADRDRGWRVSFTWTEPDRAFSDGAGLVLAVTGQVLERGEPGFSVRIHARVETPGGDGTLRPSEQPWRSVSRPEVRLGREETGEARGEIAMSEHPTIRIVLVVEGGVRAVVAAWTYRREESSSTIDEAGPEALADFAGRWSTEFGDLVLVQVGSRVTGRFERPDGTLEGDVSGDTLRFHWTHTASGRRGAGRFVLGPDDRLSGAWNSGEDPGGAAEGIWNGIRRSDPAGPDAGGSTVEAGGPGRAPVLPGGSVSGSVLPAPAFGSPEPAAGTARATLQAGQRRVAEGETVTLPIYLIGARDVSNLNVEIRFDPSVVRAGGVEPGGLLGGALFESNAAETGIVRLAFVTRKGVSGTGTIATVAFRAVGQAGLESSIALTVSAAGRRDRQVAEIDVLFGRIRIDRPEGVEPGDADGDRRVTESDARAALRMSVGKIPERSAADLDGDGRATSSDALRILEATGDR